MAAQAADGSGIMRRKAHGKESAARDREDAAPAVGGRRVQEGGRRALEGGRRAGSSRTPCALGRTPRLWHHAAARRAHRCMLPTAKSGSKEGRTKGGK